MGEPIRQPIVVAVALDESIDEVVGTAAKLARVLDTSHSLDDELLLAR